MPNKASLILIIIALVILIGCIVFSTKTSTYSYTIRNTKTTHFTSQGTKLASHTAGITPAGDSLDKVWFEAEIDTLEHHIDLNVSYDPDTDKFEYKADVTAKIDSIYTTTQPTKHAKLLSPYAGLMPVFNQSAKLKAWGIEAGFFIKEKWFIGIWSNSKNQTGIKIGVIL